MIHQDISFRCSTPMQRNDGTIENTERPLERPSLKTIASKALQRNDHRNEWETIRSLNNESFRSNLPFNSPFHENVAGEYTPYCCGVTPELVRELDVLISIYSQQYRLSEAATLRIIEAAKHQPLIKVPESIAFFKNEINR